MKWIRFSTEDTAAYSRAEQALSDVNNDVPRRHLRNHLGWVAHNREKGAVSILALENNGQYIGYALLLRQERALPFQIGELTCARKNLIRYELWAEPVFAENELSENERLEATQTLLSEIHSSLGKQEALSIEGLSNHGYFHSLITKNKQVSSQFIALQLGKPFAHQLINMPSTLDEYLGKISGRKNLRYDQRKLNKDFENVETICFEDLDSVDTFLDDAIAISQKTYQWNLLGLGLRDRENLKSIFSYAAELGWLRHYLLYVDNQPVAFMLGYQYDNCYYYTDVGFDPNWSKWSVGSVLQLNVIEDLYNRKNTPTLYDFSTGYGHHKARFGNLSRDETNIILLPKTPMNALLVQLFKINEKLEAASVWLLERLGIKKFLKKLLRTYSS